jgi:hypothetical protein
LIKERLQTEQLPAMQIDGSIEFKTVPEPAMPPSQLPPLTVASVPIIESNLHTAKEKEALSKV